MAATNPTEAYVALTAMGAVITDSKKREYLHDVKMPDGKTYEVWGSQLIDFCNCMSISPVTHPEQKPNKNRA